MVTHVRSLVRSVGGRIITRIVSVTGSGRLGVFPLIRGLVLAAQNHLSVPTWEQYSNETLWPRFQNVVTSR